MKENQVAVRFYKGYISNEKVTLKRGDANIVMKRVKMPNDDPESSLARRSFIVKESDIGTDTKNPNMKFVYMDKDSEHKIVRKNYDPETKKSEILEESTMTGQEIADVFKAARDREYAEWKAQQPVNDVEVAAEIDAPEEVIEANNGMEM